MLTENTRGFREFQKTLKTKVPGPVHLDLDYEEADAVRRAFTRAWADAPAGSPDEKMWDDLLIRLGASRDAAEAFDAEATRLFGPGED